MEKQDEMKFTQILVNLKNFRFWDQICPKNMNEKNCEKLNIKAVVSI